MPRCRCLAVLLLLSFLVAPASQAQDDIEIALPYQLVEGRLSVTFADTVSEAHALHSLAALGYEVVQHDFSPVIVTGLVDGLVPESDLDQLKAHPLVEHVKLIDVQEMRERGLENLQKADPEVHARAAAAYAKTDKTTQSRFIVTLSPTLTTDEAVALVTSLYPNITIQQTSKRPNEIIIAVEEGSEEAAIEQIDALPEVRYVAYINAN